MVEVVHYRERRSRNVEHGRYSLQLVVPGLVEVIAEPDDSRGFAGEINRQASCAAAEKTGYRVQFFSTVLQDGSGQRKVSGAESSDHCEKSAVLAVPKSIVAGCFR